MSSLKPITEYIDYREFLRDQYQMRKSRTVSYNYDRMARELGLSSGNFFCLILNGHKVLGLEAATRVAKKLGLSGADRRSFIALVKYGNAKDYNEAIKASSTLIGLRQESDSNHKDEIEFFSSWHHMVVRELLYVQRVQGTAEEIAKLISPPISTPEAEKSLKLLFRLGLASYDEKNETYQPEGSARTDHQTHSILVHKYHDNVLQQARNGLVLAPPTMRDYTVTTIKLNKSMIQMLKEKIYLLQQEALEVEDNGSDTFEVFHLAIQLFPVSKLNFQNKKVKK